jgi:sec-independent protein translocase protein TatC
MTDISAYLDFVLTLFFAFGVAFEIPVATVLLVLIGAVTPEDLVNKRPYVIVGAFIIGMFLTPPDVFSQTMLAVPMWLLFELGIIFSRMLLRQRAAMSDHTDPPPAPPSAVKKIPPTPPAPTAAPILKQTRISAVENAEAEADQLDAELTATPPAAPAPAAPDSLPINSVEAKLLRAKRLRELHNLFATRQVLYEVLEEGDAGQRAVARNILAQLDEE